MLGWRSPEDEKLLLAISKACSMDMETPYQPTTHSPLHLITHKNHVQMNGIANGGTSIQNDRDSHSDGEEEWSSQPVTLMVFDLRSYTAALGNRAKGGGCECTGEVADRRM